MRWIPALLLVACTTAPDGAVQDVAYADDAAWRELFDGETLDGWRELGDARWTVEDGTLVGEVDGGSQSFLASEERFGDFVLELELRNEAPGNSGVQIRSRVTGPVGGLRVVGYQVEVDPSDRSWSGGLYEEGGGWLQDLADSPAARAAFRNGEWNRYRIECRGPRIRVWVNDVPTVDWTETRDDAGATSGVIALQVHSGDDTRVRWRNVRLLEL